MDSARSRARLFEGPFWFALPVLAALVWRLDFLVDDAFISYRYGRHLADGLGLVWNPGESPPVEGFSNFLWTLLCAGLELAGLAPELWTRILGAAAAAATVAFVVRLVQVRVAREVWTTRLAALLAASFAPFAAWATGGLETMAFTLAVFATFERLLADRERPSAITAALWASAAVLLRADGFVWVSIALFAAWTSAPGSRELRRALLCVGGAALATALLYLAFRWNYFESLQPNTARVKVAFGAKYLVRGAQYVASLCLCVVSIPLVLGGAAVRARRDASGVVVPCLAFVASAFAYLVVLGGDWMMYYRMAVPVLPFVAVLAGAWFATMRTNLTRAPIGVACAALAALPAFEVHVVPQSVRELAHFRWSQGFRSEHAMWQKGVVDIRDWMEIGRALAVHTKPGESMVIGNIGAFGYYPADLVIYDTQGLTNHEPLLPDDPKAREMPGHDRKVVIQEFEKYRPTYLTARIVDSRTPWVILSKNWQDVGPDGSIIGPNATANELYEFDLEALDPAQGFRENTALLLIRFRR